MDDTLNILKLFFHGRGSSLDRYGVPTLLGHCIEGIKRIHIYGVGI
jgi:hypothetical protein